jgi:ribonuclease-3 family protein
VEKLEDYHWSDHSFINIKKGEIKLLSKKDIDMLSPLVWAYMGDAVYEQYVREHIIMQKMSKNGALHKKAIKYVSANNQLKILKYIEEFLTEDELEIIKRGRNSNPHSHAKNADIVNYKWATGFEALIGYLYLTGNKKRLTQIIDYCFSYIDKMDNKN